jgi:quinol-cytochrome oxidoreductase complex cytochrome b subunit
MNLSRLIIYFILFQENWNILRILDFFILKLLKTHPFLSLVNSYVIDSPIPVNITYLWNFGSLLGLVLVIQIITGVTLATHYVPNIDLAFASIEHNSL